jgi:hypothetical protein
LQTSAEMTTTESKTFGSVTTQSNQTIAGTDEVVLKVPKTFAQMPLGFAIDAGELDFVYENSGPMRIAVCHIDMHYTLDTSVPSNEIPWIDDMCALCTLRQLSLKLKHFSPASWGACARDD